MAKNARCSLFIQAAICILIFCLSSSAQVPSYQRNDFTTNINSVARGVVTTIVNSLVSTGGISTTTATNIANYAASSLLWNRYAPNAEFIPFDNYSNQLPARTFTINNNGFRTIGSASNYSGFTNGMWVTDFVNNTNAVGGAASYVLTTNTYPVDVIGLEYSLQPNTQVASGHSQYPFSILILSSNSMDAAGVSTLTSGFHIEIQPFLVNVKLFTNGIANTYDLGNISFNTQPFDGQRRTINVVFNGNKTITITGDGIQGTLTNALVDAYRPSGDNKTYLAFEQFLNGTGNPYYQLRHHSWFWGNRPAYSAADAGRLMTWNRYTNSMFHWTSNNIVDIGLAGKAVSEMRLFHANANIFAQFRSNYLYYAGAWTNTLSASIAGGALTVDTTGIATHSGSAATMRFNDRTLATANDGHGFYRNNGVAFLYDYSAGANQVAFTNGRVGINTNTPSVALEVQGAIQASGNISSSGNLNAASGSLTVAAGGQLKFNGRSGIQSPRDGDLDLVNNAGTGFNGLRLAATLISNSSVGLEFRDTTGTSPTNIVAKEGRFSGGLRLSGFNATSNYVWTCTNATTGAGEWRVDTDSGGGGSITASTNDMTALMSLNGVAEWVDLGNGMYIDDSLQFGASIFGANNFGTASANRGFGQLVSPGLDGSHQWFTCLASNGQYGALRYGGNGNTIGATAINLWSNRFNASAVVYVREGGNNFTNVGLMFGSTSGRFDTDESADGVRWLARPAGNPSATWYAGCGIGSTWTYVTSTIPVTNYLVKLSMQGNYNGVAFFTNDVWFAGISNNIPTNRIYAFGVRHMGLSSGSVLNTNQVWSFWRNIKALIQ